LGKTDSCSQSKTNRFISPSRVGGSCCVPSEIAPGKNVEEWLARIIKERVELEEVAFNEAKRALSLRNGS
jgi:hypothetical protein